MPSACTLFPARGFTVPNILWSIVHDRAPFSPCPLTPYIYRTACIAVGLSRRPYILLPIIEYQQDPQDRGNDLPSRLPPASKGNLVWELTVFRNSDWNCPDESTTRHHGHGPLQLSTLKTFFRVILSARTVRKPYSLHLDASTEV